MLHIFYHNKREKVGKNVLKYKQGAHMFRYCRDKVDNRKILWWKCLVVPQKLNIELSYDPAILLLGVHQKLKTGTQIGMCTPML